MKCFLYKINVYVNILSLSCGKRNTLQDSGGSDTKTVIEILSKR